MEQENFNSKELLGKSKSEIVKLIGQEFNYYHYDEWTFFTEKVVWWGRKKQKITLLFKNNMVNRIRKSITWF